MHKMRGRRKQSTKKKGGFNADASAGTQTSFVPGSNATNVEPKWPTFTSTATSASNGNLLPRTARHFEVGSDFWWVYQRDTNKHNTSTSRVSALLPRGTDKVCQCPILEVPIISYAQGSDHRVLYFPPLQGMTATTLRNHNFRLRTTIRQVNGSKIFSTARTRVSRIFGRASNLSNNMTTSAIFNRKTTPLWRMA
jgi:hypothetical protein